MSHCPEKWDLLLALANIRLSSGRISRCDLPSNG